MSARILVVDDEPQIGRLLKTSLGARGYEVAVASDGQAALDMAASWRPDLILLDLGLPTIDGLEVCRQVRAWSQVPIIVLTVRDAEQDKVAALDLGADDYLTKPFGNAELVARVQALLRRGGGSGGPTPAEVYDDGVLRLDPAARTVLVGGSDVRLSPTEFRLLGYLVRNRDQVMTPAQLLDRVWGDPSGIGPERVKFAVLRLRRRLGWADPDSSPIQSVRGVGYRYRSSS